MKLQGRLRGPISPERFAQIATLSLIVLGLVVFSGAFVRLTGSGLGCDNWPRCGQTPFPAADFHALVEFGNRIVALSGLLASLAAWLASRRVAGLPRWVSRAALAAFLGALAQIPLGGLTVILGLHPLAVMSHFLLALVVVGLSVVVTLEAWSNAFGLGAPVGPHWLRVVAIAGVGVCAVMVVTGAVATASGPHPGSDSDVQRLGLEIRDTVYVHVRAAAAYGIGFLFVCWQLLRARREAPGVLRLAGALLVVLVTQMIIGEVQYRNALPWGLVLVHVALAATIWALTVAIAYALWRPPAPLAVPAAAPAETPEPEQARLERAHL
ncbi:MAG TPA: COX15/CtaA family protein [Gaiella sp.]|nr:COX15/CtaA family protein [Gaiella sp.]